MILVDGVEMVDVREAARMVDRTPETIRRWVWSGRVTAHKQDNRLLLARAAVERLAGRAGGDRAAATRAASLAEWAQHVTGSRSGSPGATATDLIREVRAGR